MKKVPLYSRSRRPAEPPLDASAAGTPGQGHPTSDPGRGPAAPNAAPPTGRLGRLKRAALRHERRLWASAVLALVAIAVLVEPRLGHPPAALTMDQIDAAMRQSIEEKPLVSADSRAYEAVLPSVVRVVGLMTDGDDGTEDAAKGPVERGVGTGVVIVENGTILTNLHVVSGAKRIKVTFFDGSESDASLLNVQPENDLAVLRAKTIPDDLIPATMRSTGDLQPGDRVIAVGFPFGIGPSVSSGVVSGLKRQFRSPDGQQMLSNLIQFDAAANPGNSGGPLVTMDGEVVGIVTAILNPSHQRVFIGIGFAVPIENAATAVGLSPF
ncbi:MAG TPA: trypsin-like peptidase domain-containing protein [Caldimonas sp.]|nr:trypsin-like peptidase domain-containing protein [Caldimonas sp.]